MPSVTPARAGRDELKGALGRDLDRLLQEHVLAGRGERGESSRCVFGGVKIATALDARIGEDRLDAVAERERESSRERRAPRGARAEAAGDLDAVARSSRPLACGVTAMPRPMRAMRCLGICCPW